MRMIISKKKAGMFLALGISLLLSSIMFMKSYEISMIGDTMGIICSGPFLAGINWSDIVSNASYYGWGAYWYTFILYKLTDNYVVIYVALLIWNYLSCSLVGILIYKILVDEFKIKSYWWAAAVAGIATTMKHQALDLCNEYGVFVICWLVCWGFAKCISNQNNCRKQIWYSFLLGGILTYGLMVHERLMALIISVFFVAVLYRLLFRKPAVKEGILFPTVLAGYVIQRTLRSEWLATMWHTRGAVRNTTVVSSTQMNAFLHCETIGETLLILLTNLYKMVLSSYGMVAICLCIVIVFFVSVIKSLRSKKTMELDSLETEKAYALILCYGMAAVITAVGLGSKAVAIAYRDGNPLSSTFKVWFYERYYFPYVSILFVLGCYWIYMHREDFKKYSLCFYVTIIAIFILPLKRVFLLLQSENSAYLSRRKNLAPIIMKFFKDENGQMELRNVVLSFLLLIFLISLILYVKKKLSWFLYFAFAIGIYFCNVFSFAPVQEWGKVSCPYAAETKEFVTYVSPEYELSKDIGFITEGEVGLYGNRIYTYQFVLNRYHIVPIVEINEQNLCGYELLLSAENYCKELSAMGYYYTQIGDDQYAYYKSEELMDIIGKRYPVNSGMKE